MQSAPPARGPSGRRAPPPRPPSRGLLVLPARAADRRIASARSRPAPRRPCPHRFLVLIVCPSRRPRSRPARRASRLKPVARSSCDAISRSAPKTTAARTPGTPPDLATHFGCRSASTPDRCRCRTSASAPVHDHHHRETRRSILKFIGPVRHAHLPCFRSATPGQTVLCSCPQFAASKSGRLD
ncbi:hypothetical protein Ae717Ps2_7230c [Pseudonocardia sp. Ae717_Ps2]|nr:hypothetical protein Ae717Ps2_7230c [Pseudonocardia sp. Ae717_Ps2]